MAKYRKKPVVVNAVQITLDAPWPAGITRLPDGIAVYDRLHDIEIRCQVGDWIITGVRGERYPCKPDVFAETYELAD